MKRIRLTESQLYGLIEQALNELDWRTYANAANKRMGRAETIKKRNAKKSEYGDYTVNQLNDNPDEKAAYDRERRKARALATSAEKSFAKDFTHAPLDGDRHERAGTILFWPSDYRRDTQFRYSPKEYLDSCGIWRADPQQTAHDRKELEDYRNGKSYYIKGKGWYPSPLTAPLTDIDKQRYMDLADFRKGFVAPWDYVSDEEEDNPNESLSRKVTESVIRKLRRLN